MSNLKYYRNVFNYNVEFLLEKVIKVLLKYIMFLAEINLK